MSQQITFKKNQAAQTLAQRLATEIAYIWQGNLGDDKVHLTQVLLYNTLKEPDETQAQSGRQDGGRDIPAASESENHRGSPMETISNHLVSG